MFRVKLKNAEWDEDKHPRDSDGKFGSGSGSSPRKSAQSAHQDRLDNLQAQIDAAKAARRELHETHRGKADEARERVQNVVKDIWENTYSTVAFYSGSASDEFNHFSDAVEEMESHLQAMYTDDSLSPAESRATLDEAKAWAQESLARLRDVEPFDDEDSGDIDDEQLKENKTALEAIIERIDKAQHHLRQHVKHRRRMRDIRNVKQGMFRIVVKGTQWEESEHPRDHGKFSSKPGAGAKESIDGAHQQASTKPPNETMGIEIEGRDDVVEAVGHYVTRDLRRLGTEFQVVRDLLSSNPPKLRISEHQHVHSQHGASIGLHRKGTIDVGSLNMQAEEGGIRYGSGNVTGQSVVAVVRHEIGHEIHSMLTREQRAEWTKIYKSIDPRVISLRASRNEDEGFAESFTAYTHRAYKEGGLPESVEKYLMLVVGRRKSPKTKAWYSSAITKALFDESKHPRDHGKFSHSQGASGAGKVDHSQYLTAVRQHIDAAKTARRDAHEELRGHADAAHAKLKEQTDKLWDHIGQMSYHSGHDDSDWADFGNHVEGLESSLQSANYDDLSPSEMKTTLAEAEDYHGAAMDRLNDLTPQDATDDFDELTQEDIDANRTHLENIGKGIKQAKRHLREHVQHRRAMRDIREIKSFHLPQFATKGVWDEQKHPRDRGRFSSSPGQRGTATPPPLPRRAGGAAPRKPRSPFGKVASPPPLPQHRGTKRPSVPGSGPPPENIGSPKTHQEATDHLIWLLGRASMIRRRAQSGQKLSPKHTKELTLALNLASRVRTHINTMAQAAQQHTDSEKDMRKNPALDAFFAETSEPAKPKTPTSNVSDAIVRHNPDLDEFFGKAFRLPSTLIKGMWQESKHPRDHGKFSHTQGAGATPRFNLGRIAQQVRQQHAKKPVKKKRTEGIDVSRADYDKIGEHISNRIREVLGGENVDKTTSQYVGDVRHVFPFPDKLSEKVANTHVFYEPSLSDEGFSAVVTNGAYIRIGPGALDHMGSSGSLAATFIHELEHLEDKHSGEKMTEYTPRVRQMLRELDTPKEAIPFLHSKYGRDHANSHVGVFFADHPGHELTDEERAEAVDALIERARKVYEAYS